MLWSVLRLIFKTSSVTPDFFKVFNLILSLSTGSQSFKKVCAWEVFWRERLIEWYLNFGSSNFDLNFKIALRARSILKSHVRFQT